MKVYNNIFEKSTSIEALFTAWDEFKKSKGNRRDVLRFEWNLEPELFALHRALTAGRYRHGPYESFRVFDPKERLIHKATVRDRILHHAVHAPLYQVFVPTFIETSFSCQNNKGTHRGVDWLERALRKVSRNMTRPCFALKCDIKKFFYSIDHDILLSIIKRRLRDDRMIDLIGEIIGSFHSEYSTLFERRGLALGNLTSQLFANIYLNEFDQYMKHMLRVTHYGRYTDDFVIVSPSKDYLEGLIEPMRRFLRDELKLSLHPDKIILRKYRQGIDFLGYIVLPHYRLVRKKTRRRIVAKMKRRVKDYNAGLISKATLEYSLRSYQGVLSHASSRKVSECLLNDLWFHLED